jgi:hypothetical protein
LELITVADLAAIITEVYDEVADESDEVDKQAFA